MAYIPKQWKDLPDETTPIQASDLNHIEQGIGDLNTSIGDLNTSIGDLNTLNTTEKSNLVGAINELKKFVGNGEEGYVIFSNDFKIVWGKVASTSFRAGDPKKYTFNLPIAFKKFNIALASNIYSQGFTKQGVSSVTLTQLELTCDINNISDYFVTYIVIGV